MPQITIAVYGMDKKNPVTLTAIIDTGFNGYLQIPLGIGLPLGLKTVGVMPSTMANQTQSVSLVCEGFAEICGKTIETAIQLPNNGAILIGTQLMAKLGKNLMIDFADGSYDIKDKPKELKAGDEQKTLQTTN